MQQTENRPKLCSGHPNTLNLGGQTLAVLKRQGALGQRGLGADGQDTERDFSILWGWPRALALTRLCVKRDSRLPMEQVLPQKESEPISKYCRLQSFFQGLPTKHASELESLCLKCVCWLVFFLLTCYKLESSEREPQLKKKMPP